MRPVSWLFAVLACCSCYGSLVPLPERTPPLLVPGLEGRWKVVINPEDLEFSGPVVITQSGSGYSIRVVSQKDTTELEAHLAQIGGDTLISVQLPVDEDHQGWLVPVHHFERLRVSGDSLWESSLQLDSLKAYLEREPKAVSHITLEDADLDPLFTASAEELRRFLEEYLKRPAVYSAPTVYVRVRP